MKKLVLVFGMALMIGEAFAQQDAQFSQYMFNPILINPAYAGSREALAIAATVRAQWVAIEGAPRTNSLTVQMPLRKKKVGLGFELVKDKIGPKSVTGIMGSYSYRINFLKGKLSFGLKGGFYDYRINWNDIKYRDKADIYAGAQEQHTVLNFDYGMYYYTKSFYWGLAATHLNRDKYAYEAQFGDTVRESSLTPHIFMTIGKGFQINDNLVFSPSLMTKSVKGAPSDVDLNFNFLIDEKLWVGMSIRSTYGFVFLTEWLASEKFRIGYSYDLGLNKIGTLGGGSHEIHLGYDINIFKTKTISPRYL